ncbi:MAG TPA: 50S ribosomal protein L6, partial [Daejeonella sp.]|nr:50S ribosomal protein L6 [Daejeonella sp.]
VVGVTEGYKSQQELVGVGYRATNVGNTLDLVLGFSHHFVFELPKEINVTTTSEKGKNPVIILESIDKQLLGQVAAKIRSLRAPEPYKGKGIKFVGEVLRRKAGKSAAKK